MIIECPLCSENVHKDEWGSMAEVVCPICREERDNTKTPRHAVNCWGCGNLFETTDTMATKQFCPECSPTNRKGFTVGDSVGIEKCDFSHRESVLNEARELVTGDRNRQYGNPSEDFNRTARMWSTVLGVEVHPWQVAVCLGLVKISRITASPSKRDSWVDLAGYAACGFETTQQDV